MSLAALGGIVAAAAAASCFDGGLAFQALDARDEPRRDVLRPRLLARLVRRRRWRAATAVAFAGWPLHLVALGLAPLSLVQPTLALGLVLLLYLGHRLLGERVGRAEIGAVTGVVVAVGVLAWAAPSETTSHAGAGRLAAGLVPLALLALLPLAAGRMVRMPSAVLPFASGAAYAFTGIASKLVVDELRKGRVGGVVFWTATIAIVGFAGLLLEMSALQLRPATHVGPMVFVVQVVVPVLLAPLVGGESWSSTPLGGGVIVLAAAAVAACAVVLMRSPAVAKFADEAARG